MAMSEARSKSGTNFLSHSPDGASQAVGGKGDNGEGMGRRRRAWNREEEEEGKGSGRVRKGWVSWKSSKGVELTR